MKKRERETEKIKKEQEHYLDWTWRQGGNYNHKLVHLFFFFS